MATPARGEIWWAVLPAPVGRRPVLILTRDSVIASRTHVTVAPLTRTRRGIASEVDLSTADGLPKASTVSLDSIQTISKALLRRKITRLSASRLDQVCQAIHFALDLVF